MFFQSSDVPFICAFCLLATPPISIIDHGTQCFASLVPVLVISSASVTFRSILFIFAPFLRTSNRLYIAASKGYCSQKRFTLLTPIGGPYFLV